MTWFSSAQFFAAEHDSVVRRRCRLKWTHGELQDWIRRKCLERYTACRSACNRGWQAPYSLDHSPRDGPRDGQRCDHQACDQQKHGLAESTVHLRYFSGSVSPGRSSSQRTLAIQKRPRECTIWIELMPRVNGWLSFSACRLSYVLHTWMKVQSDSHRKVSQIA